MNLRHIIIGMMISIATADLSATNVLDIAQPEVLTTIKLYLTNPEITRLNNTCAQLYNTKHRISAIELGGFAPVADATSQLEDAYSLAERTYEQAPYIRDVLLDNVSYQSSGLLELLNAYCPAIKQIVNDITTKKRFSDCNAIHTIQPSHLEDVSELINFIIVLTQGINLTSLTINDANYVPIINKLIDSDPALKSRLLPRLQKLSSEGSGVHTTFFTNGQRLIYIFIANLEPLMRMFSNDKATTLTNLKHLRSDRCYSDNQAVIDTSALFNLVVEFLTKHPQLQSFNCGQQWSNKALNEAKKQNPSLNIQEMYISNRYQLTNVQLTCFLPQLTIIILKDLSDDLCRFFLGYVKEFGLPNAQRVAIAGKDINHNTTWTAEDGEGITSLLTQCPQLTQLSLEGLPKILGAVHTIPTQSHLQTLTIDSRCIGCAFKVLKKLCAINNRSGKPLTTKIIIDCEQTNKLIIYQIFLELLYENKNAYTFTFASDFDRNGIRAFNSVLRSSSLINTPLFDSITELFIALPEAPVMITSVLENIFAKCTNLTDLSCDIEFACSDDLVCDAIINGIRLGYTAAQQKGRILPLRILRIYQEENDPRLQPNALYQYFPNLITLC